MFGSLSCIKVQTGPNFFKNCPILSVYSRQREREREREMGSISAGVKPHVVCFPGPLQGHINPMFKLAKLLHQKGFHVTFVNIEYNHKRLLRSRGHNSLDGFPGFHFETIPDGLPPSDADVSQGIPSLVESLPKTCLVPLCNLIPKLNYTSSSNAQTLFYLFIYFQ